MRLAVLFDHFGPYHLARLRAASVRCEALGVEFHGRSGEYDWEPADRAGLNVVTLLPSASTDSSAPSFVSALDRTLSTFRPEVVAIPGWSSREVLSALSWCLHHQVPAVLMSESSAHDERRAWWKEWIKRRLVALFSAALVGGSRHATYLNALGMPPESIFTGYDVVDNAHFAPSQRWASGSGTPHFLASARFVEKKNLPGLLRAFAAYRDVTVNPPWNLVLLGDGPQRPVLEELAEELAITDSLSLPGFRQYDELPGWYARASAFVHASTTEQWGLVVNEAVASGLPVIVSDRCGCAPELVRDGINGCLFDPAEPDALTRCLLHIASLTKDERARMGHASLGIATLHGPEHFGEGLLQAATVAVNQPPRTLRQFDKLLLSLLSHR